MSEIVGTEARVIKLIQIVAAGASYTGRARTFRVNNNIFPHFVGFGAKLLSYPSNTPIRQNLSLLRRLIRSSETHLLHRLQCLTSADAIVELFRVFSFECQKKKTILQEIIIRIGRHKIHNLYRTRKSFVHNILGKKKTKNQKKQLLLPTTTT